MTQPNQVTEQEMQQQQDYIAQVCKMIHDRELVLGRSLRAHIDTFGCQQNENDSERIMGMLLQMGFEACEQREDADLLFINTCAVREHAEDRVYGNLGILKKIKEKNPHVIIGMCGCMAQQSHVSEIIGKKYRHVNLLFGPHAIYRLPELMYRHLMGEKNVVDTQDEPGRIAEGLPQARAKSFSAYVTIMSGCNNFCSYCIVPHVRGRERSRNPQPILDEIRDLVNSGCREVILLGQNVNSYGKDNQNGMDFAALLTAVNEIEGDFRIKFMTSHPKDITRKVLDVMAKCEKVCKHLHLPVQSGSNRILEVMNRKYTREQYLDTIAYAKQIMPDITFTSDIIVGFPGESDEDFEHTLSLVQEVQYEMLFSFIFSPRKGTPAYSMPNQIPYPEKLEHFNRLLQLQEEISAQRNQQMEGMICRVLCTGRDDKNKALLAGRTDSNKLVFFPGNDDRIGTFCNIKIKQAKTWFLFGEEVE